MNKKPSLLSHTMLCIRQVVLRVGFKFKLATGRVRVEAPSRLLMALLASYSAHLAANPTGGQVVSGDVTIGQPAANTLNINQTSAKGIVNWQSFSIGSGEKVNFIQPNAAASTLNRIVGSDASSIYGQLNANGQVFLLNPNGVLFAPGSQVNVGGLVASTLQMNNARLSGRLLQADRQRQWARGGAQPGRNPCGLCRARGAEGH